MIHLKVVAVLASTAGVICTARATTWDLATDFSATNNPNGPWQYGTRMGGVFELAAQCDRTPTGILVWDLAGYPVDYAAVGYNPNPYAVCGIPAGHITLDCDAGEPIARWVAPADGIYDIHIAMGGVSGFDNGYGNWRIQGTHVDVDGVDIPYTNWVATVGEDIRTWDLSSVDLHAGATVDAWAELGIIGGNTDTTMTIRTSPVPEPATVVVTAVGIAGLALRRRRR